MGTCCSRLFKVTGRLIGMLMIYGGGRGRQRADIFAMVFLGTGLG